MDFKRFPLTGNKSTIIFTIHLIVSMVTSAPINFDKPIVSSPSYSYRWCQNNALELLLKRVKRSDIYNYERWDKQNITWALSHQHYPRDQMSYSQITDVIRRVVAVWHEAIPYLNLIEMDPRTGQPDIFIAFYYGEHGDSMAFGMGDGTVAHAYPPGDSPAILGDIHIDMNNTWTSYDNTDDKTSLYSVLLHEFGHSLGLMHTSNKNSIMYPLLNSEILVQIPQVDRETLLNLYHEPILRWESENNQLYNHHQKQSTTFAPTIFRPITQSSVSTTTIKPIQYPIPKVPHHRRRPIGKHYPIPKVPHHRRNPIGKNNRRNRRKKYGRNNRKRYRPGYYYYYYNPYKFRVNRYKNYRNSWYF